jgi:hypothetical protein
MSKKESAIKKVNLELLEELRLLAFRIQSDVRAVVSISQQLAASGGPKSPVPPAPVRTIIGADADAEEPGPEGPGSHGIRRRGADKAR